MALAAGKLYTQFLCVFCPILCVCVCRRHLLGVTGRDSSQRASWINNVFLAQAAHALTFLAEFPFHIKVDDNFPRDSVSMPFSLFFAGNPIKPQPDRPCRKAAERQTPNNTHRPYVCVFVLCAVYAWPWLLSSLFIIVLMKASDIFDCRRPRRAKERPDSRAGHPIFMALYIKY